jgi:hypothetical protein
MSEVNDTVCLELDGLEIGWQVGPIPVEDGYVTLSPYDSGIQRLSFLSG